MGPFLKIATKIEATGVKDLPAIEWEDKNINKLWPPLSIPSPFFFYRDTAAGFLTSAKFNILEENERVAEEKRQEQSEAARVKRCLFAAVPLRPPRRFQD